MLIYLFVTTPNISEEREKILLQIAYGSTSTPLDLNIRSLYGNQLDALPAKTAQQTKASSMTYTGAIIDDKIQHV